MNTFIYYFFTVTVKRRTRVIDQLQKQDFQRRVFTMTPEVINYEVLLRCSNQSERKLKTRIEDAAVNRSGLCNDCPHRRRRQQWVLNAGVNQISCFDAAWNSQLARDISCASNNPRITCKNLNGNVFILKKLSNISSIFRCAHAVVYLVYRYRSQKCNRKAFFTSGDQD